MVRLAAIVLLGALIVLRAGAQVSCAIPGMVVDALNGQGVANAKVFITPADPSEDREAAIPIRHITSETGQFCFNGLAVGHYLLAAERAGYLRTSYGAKRAQSLGSVLTVEADKVLPPLTLKLIPQAVISGVLLDADGEPVANGSVFAMKRGWSDGNVVPTGIEERATDERGQFRLPELAAGTYYLKAARDSNGVRMSSGSYAEALAVSGIEVEADTFYRGASVFEKATPIVLRAGQELTGVSLTLEKVHPRVVSGRIPADLLKGKSGFVQVSSKSMPPSLYPGGVADDGTFQVRGIPPGEYELAVVVSGRRNEETLQAITNIDLTNGDQTDLELQPAAPMAFEMTVSVEEGGKPPEGSLELNGAHYGASGKRQPDGGWLFTGIFPGEYRVSVPRGEAYFVKQVILNGERQEGDVLNLRSGLVKEVKVVLSRRVAQVLARVTKGTERSTVPTFVLERASGAPQPGCEQSVVTGQCEWKSLAPGKYRLFAFEELSGNMWGSPQLVAALAAKSVTFEVGAGERRTVEAPLITADEFEDALRRAGF